ncbi:MULTISPECIES: DUF1150 family protein [Ruegeria]|uniref:DUF1150 family protein n=2 Tax=Ruegeria TaxID=97050 RepID=A0A6B2NV06_9RHOB|nr:MULTISPECIES: DUF1150 family protein [unclassified Ruegeria]MCU9838844.1 DUF1150 domain-containing protein [Ruegeria sp. WL0004]NDW47992.1 DUF1150 family protein [Ruegeria sp. PrR005]
MHTPYDFKDDGDRIVYVKAVDVADLPDEVRQQAGDRDHLYAVHNAQGERLALVADRKMAFVLARQNDLSPVTVH